MAIERDLFYVGEIVKFDAAVKLPDGTTPPDLVGTTVQLVIQEPPLDDDTIPADVLPSLTFAPATVAHAEYETARPGMHEWRLVTTGTIKSARQGRFRVQPVNV